MLFNEPKLLKCDSVIERTESGTCFSALQRAEIAEIRMYFVVMLWLLRFSALQRAEIAEIARRRRPSRPRRPFQCSSASRKFLNLHSVLTPRGLYAGFSALQRAENSSIQVVLRGG